MRRDERGIALPVAVIVLGMVLLLTSIALAAGVRSSKQTVRDLRVKRALQAADAGLNLARSQMNILNSSATPLSVSAPCISVSSNGAVSAVTSLVGSVSSTVGSLVTGMCAPVTTTYAGGAQSESTIVTSNGSGGIVTDLLGNVFSSLLGVNRTIVSVGSYQGVTRKVAEDVRLSSTTTQTFGNYAISALESLSFSAGGDRYSAIRSNGTIALGNSVGIGSNTPAGTNPPTCAGSTSGDSTPGPGKGATSFAAGGGTVICGSAQPTAALFSFPPYDAAAASAANNDDRLTSCFKNKVIGGLLTDWCPDQQYGASNWNATARTLRLNYDPTGPLGFGKLPNHTVRGSVYYLCNLIVTSDARIAVPSGVNVRFVIDKAACPTGTADAGVFKLEGTAGFESDSGLASTVQVYVVGGGAVTMTSSRPQAFTLYAPDSVATIGGGMKWTGALAAKSVTASGGGLTLKTDGTVAGIGSQGASTYQSSNFRECLVTGGTGPLAGCDGP